MKPIEINKISKALDELVVINRKAALRGIMSAASRLQEQIITDIIPKTKPVPVDRGIYRSGWRIEPRENGAALLNHVAWAPFIEFGVKPDQVKPGRAMIQALAEWVQRKGIGSVTQTIKKGGTVLLQKVHKVRPIDALQIATAIALTMQKKGIHGKNGRGILKRVLKNAPKVIEDHVSREVMKAPWL